MDTSLLEKVGVPTLEELKAYYQRNDLTTTAARFDKKTATPSELRLYNQIDGVFMDDVVANYYIATNNKDYKVLEETLQEEEYAIGFRKQDVELCNKVNEILVEMKNDGTLGKIATKWFGKDITIIQEK